MSEHKLRFLSVFCLAGLVFLLAACAEPSPIPGTGSSTATAPVIATPPDTATAPGSAATVPAGTPTAGNSTAAATTTLAVTPTAAATPQATMTVITLVPAASQTAGASTGTPQAPNGTTTPSATGEATSQGTNVTLADDGKTIHLKVGDRFLLDLGSDYNWNPIVADQKIVSRVIGITVIRGAQGVYEAKAPGTTTLIANGVPTCLQAKPACALPNRAFEVTIVVEQ